MEKVILYDFKSDKISINIVAYFSGEGDLKVDGYDLGSLVSELRESSDYEYFLTVKKVNLAALVRVLNTRSETLLLTLQQNFNDNYAFSNFKKFLEENNIPFKHFYWN